MKTLAIIPARGGSKRIPRKNIKEFFGSPIIKYSIIAAIESGCFDEVMVSTEDREIADISRSFGASIPFIRKVQTADDKSILVDVLLETLSEYEKIGKAFDFVCCILPTAPFVDGQKLKNGYELIIDKQADAAMSVVKFGFPIQRALKINDNQLSMMWPENMHKNSQDLSPTYHDAGQFYWLRVDSLVRDKKIYSEKMVALELPESEVQDIDTEEDWKIAELKYKIILETRELKRTELSQS